MRGKSSKGVAAALLFNCKGRREEPFLRTDRKGEKKERATENTQRMIFASM
jgi:hypothetical protein